MTITNYEADITRVTGSVGIVLAQFNGFVTEPLLQGALQELQDRCGSRLPVQVVRVPGAFELPLALGWLAATPDITVLVALGCVIRGQTPHFDYVCSACTRGIDRVAERSGIAVGFGLLTCDDADQAIARAGGSFGNKGGEAMVAALEMAALKIAIDKQS